jgi:hypothetical protein
MSLEPIEPTRGRAPVPAAGAEPTACLLAQLGDRLGGVQALAARRNAQDVREAVRNLTILEVSPRSIPRARAIAARIPDRMTLSTQADELHAAAFDRATPVEARFVFAAVLDSIPAAHAAATKEFLDALEFTLEHADDDVGERRGPSNGFSLPVLFVTARRILASSTYCPSCAEILAAAREARAEMYSALLTTERLMTVLMNAEEVLDLIEATEVEEHDPLPA